MAGIAQKGHLMSSLPGREPFNSSIFFGIFFIHFCIFHPPISGILFSKTVLCCFIHIFYLLKFPPWLQPITATIDSSVIHNWSSEKISSIHIVLGPSILTLSRPLASLAWPLEANIIDPRGHYQPKPTASYYKLYIFYFCCYQYFVYFLALAAGAAQKGRL